VNASTRRQVIVFLVGVFLISWAAELPMVLAPRTIPITSMRGLELLFVASVSPSLMAIVLTAVGGGLSGVRGLLGQLVRWRTRPAYYAIALALPTALTIVALLAPTLLGVIVPPIFIQPPNPWTPTVSPAGEELGWRGYLLPRLQPRYGALITSLLVGVAWAAWHAPQWMIPGARFSLFPVFFVRIVAESVFLSWLYNRTRGSLLICILAHAGMNLSIVTLSPLQTVGIWPQLVYMLLFCGVAGLIVWRTHPVTLNHDRGSLSLVVDGAPGTDHAERKAYPA
jgi:CAAX protease family protein